MCSGIKRYDFFATFVSFDNYCQLEAVHEVDGEWVKYEDHKKIVDELQGKIMESIKIFSEEETKFLIDNRHLASTIAQDIMGVTPIDLRIEPNENKINTKSE